MVPTNDFLPFCPTNTGTNLESQSDYLAAADRTNGNQPGVASSKLNNKAIRQATYISSQVAQLVANLLNSDVIDNATPAQLLAQLTSTLAPKKPIVRRFVASGTYNMSYIFGIVSGNATTGATYTNNGVTYTVTGTVAAGVQVTMTGNGAPTVSGTLTKASGTGDATLTFYSVAAPLYLLVEAIGGGSGGTGSGTAAFVSGAGGDTTLGGTLVVAGGAAISAGGNGANSKPQGGGIPSVGAGAIALIPLVEGAQPQAIDGDNPQTPGSPGAASIFGGNGFNGTSNEAAIDAVANSGSGGGGAGAGVGGTNSPGCGGSCGGYVKAQVPSPASTYAVVIGAGGAFGAAAAAGFQGGAGGSGAMTITECFQ